MSDDFDGWLEQQLSAEFARVRPTLRRPPAISAVRGSGIRFLPALPVAIGAKAATGLTLAALALGGTTAVAVSDATGHSSFGKSVAANAQQCAQSLQHGAIGDCVSDFVVARNHGASERSSHANPDAASHGNAPAGTPGKPATTKGHGAPVTHPTGKP